ncbi:transcriptional regulator ATRX homolog [Bradysia coprophila]|uniref:transcriptional regulator ATRX homolog n=1 Tax=Bradysia coprophila TaxID=38358 RepID=UPI00187D7BD4|nr:transcriptional regulator ATRX homolog [Bradysia coprophila]
MNGLLTVSEIKVEPVDPDESESVWSTLPPSIVQISEPEEVGNKFDVIKKEVCQTIAAYKQKFELEAQQRLSLEVALRKEVKQRQSLEQQVKDLTGQVETVSKERNDMKEELRQSQHNVKRLQDELNLKELEANDLNKQYQKLLKEKASFNKIFKDRLATFLNDVSFPDADNNLEIESDFLETSGQTDKKRSNGSDTPSAQDESNTTSKRFKTSNPSSPDSHASLTFEFVKESESVVEAQPILNDSDIPTKTEPLDENAASNRIETSMDNVESDWRGDVSSYLDIVLNEKHVDENSNHERQCRSAGNSDMAVSLYENPISNKPRSVRRNIKRIMEYESLTQETKQAYQQEKERKKQYARRIQKYNETYGKLPGELNQMDQILLDFDLNTKSELLAVDKRLSTKLKPHQCEGVKFMWDACFESIEKLHGNNGSGCILSHCMGLGKTLQVITLVHTLLRHSDKTNVKKVLIICPVNVILNWVDEFDIWLKSFPKHESVKVFELVSNPDDRTNQLRHWHLNGGVLIIGYRMFQMMYQNMERQLPTTYESTLSYKALINPGADVVVCDEGHLLKNPSSQLSATINKIRTLRRIVLTGTPLQNNLKEYFAMVEFVKPRLLGTEKEFSNRFIGPIVNGQFVDSTEADITLMKYRAYILHKLLEGCVHRRDYSVLAQFLPPKEEHVLFIRLTKKQMDLYKYYMVNFIVSKPVNDLPPLRRICNHPMVLADFEDRHKLKPSTSDKTDTDRQAGENLPHKPNGWWKPICSGYQLEMSNKMLILSTILSECEMRNEKVVVFSGCLSTLNVIEHFLKNITETTRNVKASSTDYRGVWKRDLDYSRLDGGQNAEKRKRDVTRFNKETNTRTRLFLISTKAGSLGINLIAANRVVIFDASWNPSDDIQSIFRVYRIGQEKKCYIYRFVSLGTMEEKIYDRQVSKLSIAKRVIDKHQIGRHYKEEDLQQLYSIDNLDPPTKEHTYAPTEDCLLNVIFRKYGDIVYKHHDHDSLLENVAEETVTEEDVGDFWEIFE